MSDFPRRRGGYYHYNGRRYVTVTTVLRALAKPALVPWAAKEAAKAIFNDPYGITTEKEAVSAIYKTRDRAGDRGRAVHNFAEAIGKARPEDREAVDFAQVAEPYVEGVYGFFATMQPDVLFTEVNVYNDTYGYAGTADLVAEIADQTWLIDYKTSKAVYPETGLQLAAYQNAEYILTETEENTYPISMQRNGDLFIDATAAVLLRPGGQFEWHPMQGDFEAFLALKKVWEWQNK
ncbi:MAG: hypothetical protein LN413_00395 [Candidatus Thermoplasmatota archaeon]|nr:hypothetical protein [Candidatus Thermoplasmatota archaeon]